MADFMDTLDTNTYFLSLPNFVQENIKMTGVKFQSEAELRQAAEAILKRDWQRNSR